MWAEADLQAVPACPVCESGARELLHGGLGDQVFGVAGGSWGLHRCRDCGAAYLDPRPADHALRRAYAAYYTHEPPGAEPPSESLARALRNGWLNRRLGYDLRPATALGPLVVPAIPGLRAATARLFRHLERPPGGGRLLDVGCGNGAWVAHMRAGGWDAEGIDLDAAAVQAGRAAGLPVRVASVDDAEPAAFDAVTLSHVLEHVPDPIGFLRACARALRPGGRLWIASPNLASTGHRRFGRHWLHLDPPRHLVLFGPRALQRALATAGLELLSVPPGSADAASVYAQSAAIAAGRLPLGQAEHLPPRLRGPARLAELRGRLRPATAEELVVVAALP